MRYEQAPNEENYNVSSTFALPPPLPNLLSCDRSLSGNDEYGAEVSSATAAVWDNSGAGAFLFTSSGGIYAERDGGIVNEESPTSDEPRSAKLRGEHRSIIL